MFCFVQREDRWTHVLHEMEQADADAECGRWQWKDKRFVTREGNRWRKGEGWVRFPEEIWSYFGAPWESANAKAVIVVRRIEWQANDLWIYWVKGLTSIHRCIHCAATHEGGRIHKGIIRVPGRGPFPRCSGEGVYANEPLMLTLAVASSQFRA
jgi:hypothetical protein